MTTNKQVQLSTASCCFLSMVSTRPTNKDAHPGYWDLPNPQHKQSKPTSTDATLIQQEHAIQNIAAIEQDLLTKQRSSSVNACQPPGPSIRKERPVKAIDLSSQLKSKLSTNSSTASSGMHLVSCVNNQLTSLMELVSRHK